MAPTLESYKGSYRGERLFVCGNAPSLGVSYPLLKDEYTFACNYLMYWKELPFLPSFYGITEPLGHKQRWERRDEMSKEIEHRFYLARSKIVDGRASDWTWLPKNEGPLMHSIGFKTAPPFATAGTTPLNIGVQFGHYMGFKDIYILGVELSNNKEHVYEMPSATSDDFEYMQSLYSFGTTRKQQLLDSFNEARRTIEDNDGSLVNCTPSGYLKENFGYTPLEEVLCK